MKIETFAQAKSGKLAIKQREKFAAAVADLPYEETEKNINKLLKDDSRRINKRIAGA